MKDPAFGRTYTNFRGRITPAQKSALERYSGLYSCTDSMSLGNLVRDGVYKGIGLDIGFGMGVDLMRWAEEEPDTLIVVLGVESEAKTANESLSKNSNLLNSVISSLKSSVINFGFV